ncbi:MAG: aminoglycoside phosphotransferase family protein [Armatimonadota bacterium]|nr:aminoglycoside phosphotransferase family protein [Armatimonadota bacterium]
MPYSVEFIREIAGKHGIQGEPTLMPASGMVNEAWLLDDRFVLRINIVDDADDEPAREAFVVPIVRAAGVRSPELIAVNTNKEAAGCLYTIYAKADGELLGHLEESPELFNATYRELGRELALLHSIQIPEDQVHFLRKSSSFDAAVQLEKTADAGKLLSADIDHVEKAIEKLAGRMGEGSRRAFLHQDIHPWNMFVDRTSRELTAIIDWGDAAWGDPAGEFSSMPLTAFPEMLAGYEEAGGFIDDGMKARSLSLGLALSLWEVRELDPARFKRQWWRHSVEGYGETLRLIDRVLES